MAELTTFQAEILEGIPAKLPAPAAAIPAYVNRAPKRNAPLSESERHLALKNALRYFPASQHQELAGEFAAELRDFGHIYMFRMRPQYEIKARPLSEFPHRSIHAACIMLMLSNNLDPRVAQHPYELVTYGGNGAVFQNWAQYRLCMRYLAELNDRQTLVLYSGHPLGIFPSNAAAPRVVVTNGMVVPNYSNPAHLDLFNAIGVSQYGQMTAGSFMYIGPQGIVHGTTITLLNACRKNCGKTQGRLFVTSGLGGMSGAQAKAGVIAGTVTVVAEVNEKALKTRHTQGWVDEVFTELGELSQRIKAALKAEEAVSLAYHGNVVDLWEYLVASDIKVDIGSDQTSLHNPYGGGYYPVGLTFSQSNALMANDPAAFKLAVQDSLRRQVRAINQLATRGMYFFDYGNAFLLEASRAGAEICDAKHNFRYPSYVEHIMGPLCFDYGFGPFRWVCSSCDPKDLDISDQLAAEVLAQLEREAPPEIKQQLTDNRAWIEAANRNKLVVGSQARILYADAQGRVKIATKFNQAIRSGKISAPIILGRDHHDVSGTDSPYRETANIYDGSRYTADMSVHNVIGDAMRGATWVSLHNGGGVGWGEVINGGFGLVLDGSEDADRRLSSMLGWDVNNGVARRSWARNSAAIFAIKEAMKRDRELTVTLPNIADDDLIDQALKRSAAI